MDNGFGTAANAFAQGFMGSFNAGRDRSMQREQMEAMRAYRDAAIDLQRQSSDQLGQYRQQQMAMQQQELERTNALRQARQRAAISILRNPQGAMSGQLEGDVDFSVLDPKEITGLVGMTPYGRQLAQQEELSQIRAKAAAMASMREPKERGKQLFSDQSGNMQWVEEGGAIPVGFHPYSKAESTFIQPAQKAYDQAVGKELADFSMTSAADIEKNIGSLREVSKKLSSGKNLSGTVVGNTPEPLLAITNPEALDVRQRVEEVAQRNLRAVLGGQFAEREGAQLIARAYNPRLDEATNKRRVDALIKSIESAYRAKQDALDYLQKNGTMAGYNKKFTFTIGDFERAIEDSAPVGGAKKTTTGGDDPLGLR